MDPGLRRDDDYSTQKNLFAMGEKVFFVYLLASGVRGTLYVGVTSDLLKRIWEHNIKAVAGFTARHGIDRLVWY